MNNTSDNSNGFYGQSNLSKRLVYTFTKFIWLIAPAFTTQFIFRMFFSPKGFKTSESQKTMLQKAEVFHITLRDKMVKVWKWGEGPAVVLAHGWGGRGIQLSEFISPLIDSGHSVIAYDNPAHGDSGGINTNYFEFVETIKAVYDSTDGVKAVIAHSFGAAAALNLDDAVKGNIKLVLISPIFYLEEEIYKYARMFGLYEAPYKKVIEELELKHGFNLSDVSPSTLSERVSSQSLIIHDELDKITPISQATILRKYLKHSKIIKTYGLGHSRLLKDIKTVDHAIRFLNGSQNGK